jgi:hypothetical protein
MAVLERNFRGDLTDETVDVYLFAVAPDDVCAAVKAWAKETATALMPSKFHIFARHRWLTGMSSIDGPALLANVHRLLVRALPQWLQAVRKSKKACQSAAVDVPFGDQLVAFAPDPSSSSDP